MKYDFKLAEKSLEAQFDRVNEIRDYNQRKVLKAFFDNKVAPEHFYTVSGYGHDDLGREVLDKVFAQVFLAEKARVGIGISVDLLFSYDIIFQEYNYGGVVSGLTQEGDRAGLGLYAGYAHMLSRHFNIEFGLGLWGGVDFFRRYSCPVCGLTVSQGVKAFVLPDDFSISVVYVF